MNYLERLLTRALAVPRSDGDAVFDPFEMVGEWPIREATPKENAVPLSHPLPAGPERATARATTDEPVTLSANGTLRPPASRQKAPLETADVFMRAIAPTLVSLPPDTIDTPSAPLAHDVPLTDTPGTHPTAEALPIVAPRDRANMSTAPPECHRVAMAPIVPEPVRSQAQTSHRAPDAGKAMPINRPAPPLPSSRATERILLNGKTPSKRDELAHTVGILRFGLGQS